MKNLFAIIASAALFFGLIMSASAADYRINSTQPIINTPATGAGIAEPLVEPPVPSASGGPNGIIEPPLPEEPVFNYRYIDVGYVYHDMDPSFSNDAGHGGRIDIYHDIKGPVYATGNFRYTSADTVDSYGARVGLGAFVEIRDRVHLTFEGGGIWDKRSGNGYSDSDFGYFVGPGFRLKFRQGPEIFANAYYRDVRGNSGFVYRGGFVFDIKPKLDLTVGAEIDDEENFYFAGVRYYF